MRQIAWFGIIFQALFSSGVMFVGVVRMVSCDGLAQNTNQFCRHVAQALDSVVNTLNVACDAYVIYAPYYWAIKTQTSFYRRLGWIIAYFCSVW